MLQKASDTLLCIAFPTMLQKMAQNGTLAFNQDPSIPSSSWGQCSLHTLAVAEDNSQILIAFSSSNKEKVKIYMTM